jgi:hypothetical protein
MFLKYLTFWKQIPKEKNICLVSKIRKHKSIHQRKLRGLLHRSNLPEQTLTHPKLTWHNLVELHRNSQVDDQKDAQT